MNSSSNRPVCSTCSNYSGTIDINFLPIESTCTCGARVCIKCKRAGHQGYTCFYLESSQEFEVIDLAPPANSNAPRNFREQEYLSIQRSFQSLVSNKSLRLKSAKLIVNKPLERRYLAKKNKMAAECGGQNRVNEMIIWHGSKKANYDIIMRDGLKVGGVDSGVSVVNGTEYGYGIYSAINPDTPIGYANDSKWLLVCLAMTGNVTTTNITNASGLDNGSTHS